MRERTRLQNQYCQHRDCHYPVLAPSSGLEQQFPVSLPSSSPTPPSRFSWPSLAVISAFCSHLHTSNPSLCPRSHFPSSSGTVCPVSVLCSAFSLAQKSCSVSLLIGLPICPCLCPHGIPRDLFENVDLNKDPEIKTPWLFPWLSGAEIKDGPFTWPSRDFLFYLSSGLQSHTSHFGELLFCPHCLGSCNVLQSLNIRQRSLS